MIYKSKWGTGIPAFSPNGQFSNVDNFTDQHDQALKQRSLRYFDFVVVLCQLARFIMMGLAAFVYGTANGGLGWTSDQLNPDQNAAKINFEALLLTTAILFFQGEGLLSFRLYRHEHKLVGKSVNGFLHSLVILLTLAGMAGVIGENNFGYRFHFNSQLAWLTLLILTGQLVYTVVGFTCFWFPRCSPKVQDLVLPVQRFSGITLFLLNIGLLLAGIVEYKGALGDCYSKLTCPKRLGLLLNLCVMAALAYGVLVCTLLQQTKWRRLA